VAFAPAGGWTRGDAALERTLTEQRLLHEQMRALAPAASEMLATAAGRRRATALIAEHYEHIPAELLAHQMLGIALCEAEPMIEYAIRSGYRLDPERIACPVRIVWGTADRLLPWPSAATRFREWLPGADWVELDGVGHCPQLDVPLEAAQLILGFAAD
jgi:pimeloyl-ACP methyl ester carboxylesterase